MGCVSPDQKVVIDEDLATTEAVYWTAVQINCYCGAGVGKSFLIKTIREMLIRTQHNHNPVLLTAPTGIAAYNIGGVTVHSAFCLPVEHKKSATYVPLRAEKLKQFRMKFKDVAYGSFHVNSTKDKK